MNVTKVKTATVALQEANGAFEISADVTMTTEAPMFSPSENGSISNGTVRENNNDLANFHSSSADKLTVNFTTADSEKRSEIQEAVTTFCVNAREFINNASVNIITK